MVEVIDESLSYLRDTDIDAIIGHQWKGRFRNTPCEQARRNRKATIMPGSARRGSMRSYE